MPVEAVTLPGMASFAASAIGSKAIGDGAAAVGQKIIAHFRETLPGQQEFIREIRKAQLNALKQVAKRNERALKQLPSHESASEEHAFSAALQSFIAVRLKTLSDKSIDFGVLTGDRIQDVLDYMVHPSPDATLADLQALARKRADEAIITEIAADAGRAVPSRLRHLIEGTGGNGWYDFFSVEVKEQLKTNEQFRIVFLIAELTDIKGKVTTGFEGVHKRFDQIDERIDRLRDDLPAGKVDAAHEAGVQEGMLRALFRRILRETDDFDAAYAIAEDLVDEAIRMMQEDARGTNSGDFVDEVLARVARTSGGGDFEGALEIADKAFAEWERGEAERRSEESQKGLTLLRAALRQAEFSLDASSVADRLDRISELEHPGDRAAQRAALRAHWDAYTKDGRIRGNPFALKVAVAIAGRLLETAETLEEKSDRYNLLGNALYTLGERAVGEDGIDDLKNAAAAFEDALQVRTRAKMPAAWADTKNNLGCTLSIIGVRVGGADGINALYRAVDAFEDALQIQTRAKMPADWAAIKNNLGSTLSIIGERTSGADGINNLNNAVAAFEDALQVRTRAKMPANWAATKNNLGNALRALGERTGGKDRIDDLKNAATAFKDALQVRTRTKMPADWAVTKNNLGIALSIIGERTGGADGINNLNNAVAAFEDALQVCTRAKMPADWAATKNNLGNTLRTLGERVGGADGINALKNAVDACMDALQVRTRADMPADWGVTKNNLGNVLRTLGERVGGTDGINNLKNAIDAYENALTVFTMETAAHYVRGIDQNLKRARAALARLQGGDG
ncbi:tetratricopeptide repeat protein [Nisaea nitritireducens]|uniref:hypothetical protein n=1 Tax=Nisaea nitritireducens TaxID=568392 RepID=UPI001867583C|nr:hypothetical protein [Nisaea nitritireducens]